MLKFKRSSVVLFVLIGMLGVSSVAFAEHEESHDEDTRFSFGYDMENHLLAINLGANDTSYECQLENGALTATYGEASADGFIPVDELDDGEDVVLFDPRPQVELGEDLVAESDPVEYTDANGECGVSGVVVAGPNGQINHGQFMKAAKSLFDIKGQGCIVRYLAKSDIGRTDETKVSTSDVDDPLFEIGETGDINFSTFEADCSRGKKDKEPRGERAAKAEKAAKASAGKSADAPGHNK